MRALFQRIATHCAGPAVFGAVLFAPQTAIAVEPAVDVGRDGVVAVSMLIDAPERNIRSVLNDVEGELADLSSDVLTVEVVKEGLCQEIDRSTRGLFRPFRIRSLRCPTAQGWHETLIASGDFSAYSTEWSLNETEEGTEVMYRVHTELFIFPRPVVTPTVVQSAKEQLLKLARKVARK